MVRRNSSESSSKVPHADSPIPSKQRISTALPPSWPQSITISFQLPGKSFTVVLGRPTGLLALSLLMYLLYHGSLLIALIQRQIPLKPSPLLSRNTILSSTTTTPKNIPTTREGLRRLRIADSLLHLVYRRNNCQANPSPLSFIHLNAVVHISIWEHLLICIHKWVNKLSEERPLTLCYILFCCLCVYYWKGQLAALCLSIDFYFYDY